MSFTKFSCLRGLSGRDHKPQRMCFLILCFGIAGCAWSCNGCTQFQLLFLSSPGRHRVSVFCCRLPWPRRSCCSAAACGGRHAIRWTRCWRVACCRSCRWGIGSSLATWAPSATDSPRRSATPTSPQCSTLLLQQTGTCGLGRSNLQAASSVLYPHI